MIPIPGTKITLVILRGAPLEARLIRRDVDREAIQRMRGIALPTPYITVWRPTLARVSKVCAEQPTHVLPDLCTCTARPLPSPEVTGCS